MLAFDGRVSGPGAFRYRSIFVPLAGCREEYRGGFRRAAASDVAGAELHTLATLVNNSLLQFNRDQERYEVHELLRQFGAEKLAPGSGGEAATRCRHSALNYAALGRWNDYLNRRREIGGIIDMNTDWVDVRVA